jgi:hypothetical protein
MSLEAPLRSLHDVPGVYGSFLADRWGTVVSRELSAVIPTRDLQSVGATLWRMWYCLDAAFADELLLDFAHHRLFARRLLSGSLGVLVGPTTPLCELRAACDALCLEALDEAFAPVGRRLSVCSDSARGAG